MRAALSFLTLIPVAGPHGRPGRAALVWFPLAGLLVGGCWALVAWGGSLAWSTIAAAALVVCVDLLVTGALHLDAVADVADGIASRKPRDSALAVMRDPAVGAVGAAACIAAILLRFSFIEVGARAGLYLLLACVPVCGRAAMVLFCALGRRSDGASLASVFTEAASLPVTLATAASAAAVCVLLGALEAALVGALVCLVALAVALLGAAVWAGLWRRRFGAVTGDGCGACGICSETAALAVIGLAPLVLA